MLRFPNPGSTIDNFVSVYGAAFERLNGQTVSLDDIVKAVVVANLATSSGYMGAEAVARSTREDRSRDPLYNQIKMYAELFRTMGWLHPIEESSLTFTFTLLGEQVVAAGRSYWPLLEECILGISYPTHVLTVKGDFNLRPFAFILRVMANLGGYLSRDEIILGPLSATSDQGSSAIKEVISKIIMARSSESARDAGLTALAAIRKTQINTLHNYTRWPIAVLRDSGWVDAATGNYADGRKYSVWRLTEKGLAVAARVESATDIRLSSISMFKPGEISALALFSHYKMLARAGFDITPVQRRMDAAWATLRPCMAQLGSDGENILFSPFQSLALKQIKGAFPAQVSAPQITSEEQGSTQQLSSAGRDDRSHLFVSPTLIQSTHNTEPTANAVRTQLQALLAHHKTVSAASSAFADLHAGDTQTAFYPLITHLFQIIGYRSDYSRAGVNYQRWDACVWIGNDAIPVEIKSPTEEFYLSTKAVRQALENKVILLSRGGLATKRELTSLVVGNRLPNERGDMSNLIDDVFSAYGMRLGVIDLKSLAHLALRHIKEGVTIDPGQLSQLRGFLDV